MKATREIVSDCPDLASHRQWRRVDSRSDGSRIEISNLVLGCDGIQAAQLSGADVLYSEDLSDGQKYGSVQVINPLRVNA